MATQTEVWVTTQFEAFHRWKDAPEGVAFLRHYHRHVFKVRVGVAVGHNDRAVEFFQLKEQLDEYLHVHWRGSMTDHSCEAMAQDIVGYLQSQSLSVLYVSVSEDGENGAVVRVKNGAKTVSGGLGVSQPPELTPSPVHAVLDGVPAVPQHLAKRVRCFVGTECEGPNYNKVLLFVPGCVRPEEFLRAWEKVKHRVSGVYLGAGNMRDIDWNTAQAVFDKVPAVGIVTVEVDSTHDLPNGTDSFNSRMDRSLVVSLDLTNVEQWRRGDDYGPDYVKVYGDSHVHWFNRRHEVISTPYSHSYFQQDREVGLG